MMCSFVCRTSPPQDDTRASTSCRSMPRMMNVGRSSSTSFTRHVVELHPPCHHAGPARSRSAPMRLPSRALQTS